MEKSEKKRFGSKSLAIRFGKLKSEMSLRHMRENVKFLRYTNALSGLRI